MATNISTIVFNAPIEKVWAALTQPVLVKQWQYESDLITDWKIGSEIRFRNEWDGHVFQQWGTILELVHHKKIKYSLFFPRPGLEDKPENYFLMTYLLTQEDQKVKLEIIQEDKREGAVQEEPQGEESPILQSLKAVVES
ncbi:SRPBCC family protein [Flavobacterium sp. Fl-318]|jgi:uncharacterized protein YndB with AHSA1/START domain|uniref:SRPBCC family protein n=1 Tax=Flavobacterium cupriresistens TaxID=2893885 RepID=A0ABU4RIF6_9FLAO|nr:MULTISPECIES: SRPBCC family protein [unclassified Flavobacterium]MDX6190336.1 SRPBCC family protein [Flavobacterium sp. Fl-318]UFH43403.1 SRPBCC domain-containing protein [Flavobacterium sp. F-323]